MKSDNIFWTTDMGLAAALMLRYDLDDLDIANPSKIAFGFLKDDTIEEYANQYWKGHLQGSFQEFNYQQLILRKRINQALKNDN